MLRTIFVFIEIVLLLSGFAVVWLAPAHSAEPVDRRRWFKSLQQPGKSGASCCSIADCHFVTARWRDGHWEAPVPFNSNPKRWTAIPEDKVLKNKVSIDEEGRAVVCTGLAEMPPTVFCFVPPAIGY